MASAAVLMLSVSATMASMWRCFARDQARLPWAWQVNMIPDRGAVQPLQGMGRGKVTAWPPRLFELGELAWLFFSDMGGFFHGVGACPCPPRPPRERANRDGSVLGWWAAA